MSNSMIDKQHFATDREYIDWFRKNADTRIFLQEFLENCHMFHGDNYYRDFHNVFWVVANRLLDELRTNGNS